MMLKWTIFVILIAAASALGSEDEKVAANKNEHKTDLMSTGDESKLTKREAVIRNNLPRGPPMYRRNTKVLYKKIPIRPKRYNSYALRKPKRNSKPYYWGPTKSRRQTKKSRRNTKPKFLSKPNQISVKNHAEKSPPLGQWRPQYGPLSSYGPPSLYGPPQLSDNNFGEPPVKYSSETKYRKPSQNYGEPPQNSHTQDLHAIYGDSEQPSGDLYDSYISPGHIGVASSYQPDKTNPQSDYFIDQGGKFDPWSSATYAKDVPYASVQKKSKSKKTKHTTARPVEDGVLVGGQYAEPPGRYVKEQGFNPSIEDYEQVYSPGVKSNLDQDADVPGSTFYNDYLNGNLAFSPQRPSKVPERGHNKDSKDTIILLIMEKKT